MLNEKNTQIKEAKKLKNRSRKKYYDTCKVTSGDINLNINRFNQAMGTDFISTDLDAPVGVDTSEGTLTEAKRYVRRYYIRPQNIFCSNKAEILKALIDLGNANCSIYTLNNLGDEKDVSKLMNSDIIYYYDNGILYDKNKVKVMDYDLSIKKEEKRKHLSNVTKTTEKEFKTVYSDRMTNATELEENLINEAFNLNFDDYNAFGERLNESSITNTCCICGEPLDDKYGNNPEPYMSAENGRCCSSCNLKFVLPARLNYEEEI